MKMISEPELCFEISEVIEPLDEIIKRVEMKYKGFKFSRTEARYESCTMAIFNPKSDFQMKQGIEFEYKE